MVILSDDTNTILGKKVFSWNPLRGLCKYKCRYCLAKEMMKKYPHIKKKYSGDIDLDEEAMSVKFPKKSAILISPMNDLFADYVDGEKIKRVIDVINKWSKEEREFIFITKNPKRYFEFLDLFPPHTYLSTIIESTKDVNKTKAPHPKERYTHIRDLSFKLDLHMIESIRTGLFLHPLLDFDLKTMTRWIKNVSPKFVVIGGANIKNAPRPERENVYRLIMSILNINIPCIKLRKGLKLIIGKEYYRELMGYAEAVAEMRV